MIRLSTPDRLPPLSIAATKLPDTAIVYGHILSTGARKYGDVFGKMDLNGLP